MSHPGGQAADYYNNNNNAPPPQNYGYGAPQNYNQNNNQPPYPGGPQNGGYQQTGNYQQMPPPQQSFEYQDPNNNKYSQPAPTYQPPQDSKESFDETFKIQKPKFHDLWAGILFIATFLGFVVRLSRRIACPPTNICRLFLVLRFTAIQSITH